MIYLPHEEFFWSETLDFSFRFLINALFAKLGMETIW